MLPLRGGCWSWLAMGYDEVDSYLGCVPTIPFQRCILTLFFNQYDNSAFLKWRTFQVSPECTVDNFFRLYVIKVHIFLRCTTVPRVRTL